MAKKKKNDNYVTEKRIKAKADKERKKKSDRQKKLILKIGIPVVCVIVAVALGLGLGLGVFYWNYEPVATHTAQIEIDNYGTMTLELYGNDAPKTVENFIKLAEEGYYEDLRISKIIDGMVHGGEGMGTPSVVGEFRSNGVKNRISHQRGVISMWHTDGLNDSGSDEFFILAEDSPKLNGKYAAFGKVVSGIEMIDKMCEDIEPYDENGSIHPYAQPRIEMVTVEKIK